MVATFHYTGAFEDIRHRVLLGNIFRPGSIGVDYFFVLSGFVILHVHARDIGQRQQLGSFLWKRAIRIYPFFWAACLPMALAAAVSYGRDAGVLQVPGTIYDLLLLPYAGEQLLGVAWSLRHELVFYAIFGAIIVAPRTGFALFVVWQIASAVIALFVPDIGSHGLLKPFAFSFNVGFGLGMIAAWGFKHRPTARPISWILAGGVAIALLGIRSYLQVRHMPAHVPTITADSVDPIVYAIAFAVLMFGLVCLERLRPLPSFPVLSLLGGSSYFLYLIHGMVGSLVIRLFNIGALRHVPDVLVFVIMLTAAIMLAMAAHVWFERPVLKALRGAFRFRPAVAQTE
jgi:peptidoglycan/LPS O-acetylase OafA/YrhL